MHTFHPKKNFQRILRWLELKLLEGLTNKKNDIKYKIPTPRKQWLTLIKKKLLFSVKEIKNDNWVHNAFLVYGTRWINMSNDFKVPLLMSDVPVNTNSSLPNILIKNLVTFDSSVSLSTSSNYQQIPLILYLNITRNQWLTTTSTVCDFLNCVCL